MRNMLSGQGGLGYTYSEPDKEVIVMNEKGSVIHDKANGEIILTNNYPNTSGADGFRCLKKIIISDKNLGATQVWNNGDTFDEAHCGKWYQWGNNYGFPYNTADITKTSSTKVDVSSYADYPSTYSSDTWITVTDAAWMTSASNYGFNLWGDRGDILSRTGPCPSGWHLPNKFERLGLYDMILTIIGIGGKSIPLNFKDIIYSPYDGYLYGDMSRPSTTTFYFWGCDNYTDNPEKGAAFYMREYPASVNIDTPVIFKCCGQHIRPFKNIYDGVMTLEQLAALGDPELVLNELNSNKGEYLVTYGYEITLCISNREYYFYTNLFNSEASYKRWFYSKGGTCS